MLDAMQLSMSTYLSIYLSILCFVQLVYCFISKYSLKRVCLFCSSTVHYQYQQCQHDCYQAQCQYVLPSKRNGKTTAGAVSRTGMRSDNGNRGTETTAQQSQNGIADQQWQSRNTISASAITTPRWMPTTATTTPCRMPTTATNSTNGTRSGNDNGNRDMQTTTHQQNADRQSQLQNATADQQATSLHHHHGRAGE